MASVLYHLPREDQHRLIDVSPQFRRCMWAQNTVSSVKLDGFTQPIIRNINKPFTEETFDGVVKFIERNEFCNTLHLNVDLGEKRGPRNFLDLQKILDNAPMINTLVINAPTETMVDMELVKLAEVVRPSKIRKLYLNFNILVIDPQTYIEFLTYYAKNIREIGIRFSNFFSSPEEVLLGGLAKLENLTSLTIYDIDCDKRILYKLAQVCPKLKKLTMFGINNNNLWAVWVKKYLTIFSNLEYLYLRKNPYDEFANNQTFSPNDESNAHRIMAYKRHLQYR